ERLRAVTAFSGDGELREGRQELSHAAAGGGFVIDDQDSPLSLRHIWLRGSPPGLGSRIISRYGVLNVAIVPPSSRLVISSEARSPYKARSRSRVFSTPWPLGITNSGSMPTPSSMTESSSVAPSRRATTIKRPASGRFAMP